MGFTGVGFTGVGFADLLPAQDQQKKDKMINEDTFMKCVLSNTHFNIYGTHFSKTHIYGMCALTHGGVCRVRSHVRSMRIAQGPVALTSHFTVCGHWFSSMFGSSQLTAVGRMHTGRRSYEATVSWLLGSNRLYRAPGSDMQSQAVAQIFIIIVSCVCVLAFH